MDLRSEQATSQCLCLESSSWSSQSSPSYLELTVSQGEHVSIGSGKFHDHPPPSQVLLLAAASVSASRKTPDPTRLKVLSLNLTSTLLQLPGLLLQHTIPNDTYSLLLLILLRRSIDAFFRSLYGASCLEDSQVSFSFCRYSYFSSCSCSSPTHAPDLVSLLLLSSCPPVPG